jgi:hypothetical protein
MYCCGTCSVALWRHLTTGGLADADRLLPAGMRALQSHRNGHRRWRRFPFHYTILALTEIDCPLAVAELRYAAPALERLVKTNPRGRADPYPLRRMRVAERALARC